MKKLHLIKLNQLSSKSVELRKNEMKHLKGGSGCVCVCMGSSYPEGSRDIGSYNNS